MSFPDKMTLHQKLRKKESLSKCAVVTFHSLSLFTMASVQKSVDACKTMHHDYQQLDNISSVLMDCTQKLNNTQKSRKEVAKLTKLSLEALDVVSEGTKTGLKTLAPSHSCATVLKGGESENRLNLAEETGIITSENDPENDLRQFLKKRKSSAGKNGSPTNAIVSPSPKKVRRSTRQMLIQNDEHPHVPANGKLFLPVELCNMLSPLDGAERSPLVSHFVEKDWLPHKGQDPARCVRRFMQKSPKKSRQNPAALEQQRGAVLMQHKTI
jgi:hypothetical protein